MIRNARKADQKAIYDLHSATVSYDRYDDMEFYFSQQLDLDNVLVNEINGHVSASLQVNYHNMMLNDTKIRVSAFLGLIGTQGNPEYLDELIRDAVDEQEHKTLVSILFTDKPDKYVQYGFEPLYNHRQYDVDKSMLQNQSFQGVDRNFTAGELTRTYYSFAGFFNGYYERDNAYWEERFRQSRMLRNFYVVYRNDEGQPEGYMIYQLTQHKIIVNEIVYLNGEALIRLLCYGFQFKNKMELEVSENEDLSQILPKARCYIKKVAMVRINDYQLFNRLFQSDVKTAREGFSIVDKPLYLSEKN